MKKHIKFITFIFTALLLSSTNTFAHQGFTKKFEKRQQSQMHHIKSGYRHGEFTFHELRHLIIAHHQLENLSQRFYKDRHYAHKERKILKNKLNEMDKMLKRMSREEVRHDFKKHHNKHSRKHHWRNHSY